MLSQEQPFLKIYDIELTNIDEENLECVGCEGGYAPVGSSRCFYCKSGEFLDVKLVVC